MQADGTLPVASRVPCYTECEQSPVDILEFFALVFVIISIFLGVVFTVTAVLIAISHCQPQNPINGTIVDSPCGHDLLQLLHLGVLFYAYVADNNL